jgi:hypothetical protein
MGVITVPAQNAAQIVPEGVVVHRMVAEDIVMPSVPLPPQLVLQTDNVRVVVEPVVAVKIFLIQLDVRMHHIKNVVLPLAQQMEMFVATKYLVATVRKCVSL